MTPELWAQVRAILGQFKNRTAEELAAELEQLRLVAPEVAREVEKMLPPKVPGPKFTPLPGGNIDAIPPTVPGYELDGGDNIRYGGMGVVYFGTDLVIRRAVAIKVLQRQLSLDPVMVKRFHDESLIAAQLQHPGIVPVYSIGTLPSPDGRIYCVMKRVRGETFTEILRLRTSPKDNLIANLAVFRRVCEALGYAHGKNIIHRDLKPSNVMIGAHGEVQLMDWGLAKLLGDGPHEPTPVPDRSRSIIVDPRLSHERTSSGLGSLPYLPPEQAKNDSYEVDQRSDVFGLGGILCVILTGDPPYIGPDERAVRDRAIEADLSETYRRLDRCGADPELIAIAKQCLLKERSSRPANGAAVEKLIMDYLVGVENRRRTAEIERARAEERIEVERTNTETRMLAEQIRADERLSEERKRNRLKLSLAFAFILLFAIMASAFLVVDRQRVAREEQTAKLVNLALGQAASLSNEAMKVPIGEPAERQRATRLWDEVHAAIDRADQAAVKGTISAEFRVQIAKVIADIRSLRAAAAHDMQLLDQLEEARASKAVMTDDDIEIGALRPYIYGISAAVKYAQAFRHNDIDIEALAIEEAATRIRSRTNVSASLIAALDDWYLVKPTAKGAEKLLAVADAADEEPLRKHIRDAIRRKDRTELLRLAKDPLVDTLPVPTVLLLAAGLERPEDTTDSARVAARAIQRAPHDFWLNDLAGLYFLYSNPPRHVEAVTAFQSALAIRPDNAMVLTNLGQAWAETNHPDRALDSLRQSLRIDPKYSITHALYVSTLQANGNLTDASAAVRNWLRELPSSVMARCFEIDILAAEGKTREAERLFQHIADVECKNSHEHLFVGNTCIGLRKFDKGIERLKLWSKSAPHQGEGASLLGFAALLNQDFSTAEFQFNRGVELSPRSVSCWLGRSLFWENQGDTAKAIDDARRAVGVAPHTSPAWVRYAESLAAAERWSEAVVVASEAIRINPNDKSAVQARATAVEKLQKADQASEARVWGKLGGMFMAKNRMFEAAEAFQQAAVLSNNSIHWNSLGNAYHNSGRYLEAVVAYRKSISRDDTLAIAHLNLSGSLLAIGGLQNREEARMAAERAVALNPNLKVASLRQHCKAFESSGEFEKCEELYRRGLALHTNIHVPDLTVDYSWFLVRRERYNEAAKLLKLVVTNSPDDIDSWILLARCGAATNTQQDIRELLARLIKQDSHDARYLRGMSVTLRRLGSVDESLRWVDRALAKRPNWPFAVWSRAIVLTQLDRHAEAIQEYKRLEPHLENDPDIGLPWQVYLDYALTLRQVGKIKDSMVALKKSRDFAARLSSTSQLLPDVRVALISIPSELRTAERLLEIDSLLDRVDAKEIIPASQELQIGLAELCLNFKNRPKDALQFAMQAFAENPKLLDNVAAGHRRLAARAAVAASGIVPEAEQSALRKQALEWLRAEIAAQSHSELFVLNTDPTFALVRDTKQLAKYSVAEQTEWETLWSDVRRRMRESAPSPRLTK